MVFWWHYWLVSSYPYKTTYAKLIGPKKIFRWSILNCHQSSSPLKQNYPLSEYLFLSRAVNSDGANPEDDSNVSLVWDLSLHGSHVTKWHTDVGSCPASAHP